MHINNTILALCAGMSIGSAHVQEPTNERFFFGRRGADYTIFYVFREIRPFRGAVGGG